MQRLLVCLFILSSMAVKAHNCQDYFKSPHFSYEVDYERVLTPKDRPDVWLVHVDLARFRDSMEVSYSQNRVINFTLFVSKQTGKILYSLSHGKSFMRETRADNFTEGIAQYASRIMDHDAYWSDSGQYFLRFNGVRLELFEMDYSHFTPRRIETFEPEEIRFLQENPVFIKQISREAQIFALDFIRTFKIYED